MSLQIKTCLSIGGLGFDICKPGQANCVKLLPTDCDPGDFSGPGGPDGSGDPDENGGDESVQGQGFNIEDLKELIQAIKNTQS
jgi:hypothetical protein